MPDLVDVYNMALDASGSRDRVSSPTETSRQAETCTLWYVSVRDQVLASAYWPSARANKRLALAATRDTSADWVSTDPDPGYLYAYSVPSNFLRARWLSTFDRFALSTDSTGSRVLSTQAEDAILTYTFRQTNISAWDSELLMAIVYALAAHICIPLHGKNMRARMTEEKANEFIIGARVGAANADNEYFDSVPSWIETRGSAYGAPQQRFLYPYGPLINVTGGVSVQ